MEVASVEAAIRSFGELVDLSRDFMASSGVRPAVDSPAAGERDSQKDENLWTSQFMGQLLVESTADHALALVRVLQQPTLTLAPWTCCRAVLESAALGCWLMDAGVGPDVRIARSMALRYKAATETRKATHSNPASQSRQRALDYVESIEQQARSAGLEMISAKGRTVGVGCRIPLITDCIAGQLDMEFEYRILSAIAHSSPSLVMTLGFGLVSDDESTFLEKRLNPAYAAYLLLRTGEATVKVVSAWGQLLGHDLVVYSSHSDAILARILSNSSIGEPPS